MNAHTYLHPAEFLERIQPELEAHEALNNKTLGITTRLRDRPDLIDSGTFFGVVENDTNKDLLTAIMLPGRPLLLADSPITPLASLKTAIDILIGCLQSGGYSVAGVDAVAVLSMAFAEAWEKAAGSSPSLTRRTRAFELRKVIFPPNPAPGFLRPACQEDWGIVAAWRYAFDVEAMGAGDAAEAKVRARESIAEGDVFLWEDHGPVSVACRARPTAHGYTINGVYTPPALRGRGYASACVAALSQQLLDGGKDFCTLFTDLTNTVSNSIYQKIGYKPIGDFALYRFP